MPRFKTQRDDGRPDWRVVYDLVCEAPPGTLFTHEELLSALQTGLDEPVLYRRVGAAVRKAHPHLQEVHKRSIDSVPGAGYRIILPDETFTVSRKSSLKALRAKEREVRMLLHSRDDEMRPEFASLVQGALHLATQALNMSRQEEKEHARRESAILKLKNGGQTVAA